MQRVKSTKDAERVQAIIEKQWEEQLLFLKTLGSFKSTLGNEAEIQHFIQQHLEDMNLKTASFDPDPEALSSYKNFGKPEWSYENRPVVVGEWKTNGPKIGKSLILQGHIDVVSAEPEFLWDTDPYNPTIIDDKMYGRGICDMKSGVAAMIYAIKAIQKSGIELGSDVHIQTVTEEECTGNGALALLDKGFIADGALITEPTDLTVTKGQVGVIWVRVKVRGAGAHVQRAELAVNAINKAAYLIQALDDYREYINNKPKPSYYDFHPHPLNVNVGTIRGGDWPSNVPAECVFEARVGFYPDQDPQDIQQEVKEWLLQAAGRDEWLKESPPEIEFFAFHAPGFVNDGESELFQSIGRAHRTITNKELESKNITATTDLRVFEEFGIPSTCYGASGANMHGANEYVDLDSLKTATKTIAAFVMDWCQVREK